MQPIEPHRVVIEGDGEQRVSAARGAKSRYERIEAVVAGRCNAPVAVHSKPEYLFGFRRSEKDTRVIGRSTAGEPAQPWHNLEGLSILNSTRCDSFHSVPLRRSATRELRTGDDDYIRATTRAACRSRAGRRHKRLGRREGVSPHVANRLVRTEHPQRSHHLLLESAKNSSSSAQLYVSDSMIGFISPLRTRVSLHDVSIEFELQFCRQRCTVELSACIARQSISDSLDLRMPSTV